MTAGFRGWAVARRPAHVGAAADPTWRGFWAMPDPVRSFLAEIFHTPLDLTYFTEGTEPSPQSSQGVWLRDLAAKLCAPCEKILEESVIDAG